MVGNFWYAPARLCIYFLEEQIIYKETLEHIAQSGCKVFIHLNPTGHVLGSSWPCSEQGWDWIKWFPGMKISQLFCDSVAEYFKELIVHEKESRRALGKKPQLIDFFNIETAVIKWDTLMLESNIISFFCES